MKRISVICASPRKFNPGMMSVDLAFHCLIQRHAIQAEINYYVLALPSDTSLLVQLPFNYQLAQDNKDAIYSSDAIVFRGDFLHSYHYHQDLIDRLGAKKTISMARMLNSS